jgi:hypothetical protein
LELLEETNRHHRANSADPGRAFAHQKLMLQERQNAAESADNA